MTMILFGKTRLYMFYYQVILASSVLEATDTGTVPILGNPEHMWYPVPQQFTTLFVKKC